MAKSKLVIALTQFENTKPLVYRIINPNELVLIYQFP